MTHTRDTLTFTTLLLALFASAAQAELPSPLELKSPNGKVVLHFDLKTLGESKGCPIYNVSYDGRPLLADSRLGLQEYAAFR